MVMPTHLVLLRSEYLQGDDAPALSRLPRCYLTSRAEDVGRCFLVAASLSNVALPAAVCTAHCGDIMETLWTQ